MQYELKKLGLDVNTHDFFGKRSRTPFVVRYTPTSPLVPQKKNGESKKQKKKKKEKRKENEGDNKEEKRKNPGGKLGENQTLLSFSSQSLSVIDHNGVFLSSTPTKRKEVRKKEKRHTKDISKSPKKKHKNSTTNATISLSVVWSSPSRTRTTSNSSKTSRDVASMPAVLFDTKPWGANPTPTPPKKSKTRATPKSSPLTLATEPTPTIAAQTSTSLDSAPSTTSSQVPDPKKTTKTQPSLRRASSGAVTILDLIQAGVLVVEDEISFRGEVTKLLQDGTMNYKGQLFTSLSKWATTVIRTTGGSQNSQVNGWRCNSVRYNKPLSDLRDLYQMGKLPISPPPPSSSSANPSTSTYSASTMITQATSTEQGITEKINDKEKTKNHEVLKEEVEVMELQESKQEQLSALPAELRGDIELKVKEFEEVEDSEEEKEEDEDDESDSDDESESSDSEEESSEEENSSEDDSEEEEGKEVNVEGESKKEFISLMDGFGLAVEAEDSPEEEEEVISITSPSPIFFSPTRDSPSDSSSSSITTTQVFLTSVVEMQDEEEGKQEEEDTRTMFLEENADSGNQGSTEEHMELSDAEDIVNQMLSFE
jgi:hypothetical protein